MQTLDEELKEVAPAKLAVDLFDRTGDIVGTATAMSGNAVSATGVLSANSVTFTGVASGLTVKYIIVYYDTGSATFLAFCDDTGTGLPYTTTGANVLVNWSGTSTSGVIYSF